MSRSFRETETAKVARRNTRGKNTQQEGVACCNRLDEEGFRLDDAGTKRDNTGIKPRHDDESYLVRPTKMRREARLGADAGGIQRAG